MIYDDFICAQIRGSLNPNGPEPARISIPPDEWS